MVMLSLVTSVPDFDVVDGVDVNSGYLRCRFGSSCGCYLWLHVSQMWLWLIILMLSLASCI